MWIHIASASQHFATFALKVLYPFVSLSFSNVANQITTFSCALPHLQHLHVFVRHFYFSLSLACVACVACCLTFCVRIVLRACLGFVVFPYSPLYGLSICYFSSCSFTIAACAIYQPCYCWLMLSICYFSSRIVNLTNLVRPFCFLTKSAFSCLFRKTCLLILSNLACTIELVLFFRDYQSRLCRVRSLFRLTVCLSLCYLRTRTFY
jgi:hypothetical protein